ncbi:MAG: hypothetical protein K0U66_09395 [Gammaproteobacteria bacterium]|nr:hypothetical protein [Gammaproteobacteria bacterium]
MVSELSRFLSFRRGYPRVNRLGEKIDRICGETLRLLVCLRQQSLNVTLHLGLIYRKLRLEFNWFFERSGTRLAQAGQGTLRK